MSGAKPGDADGDVLHQDALDQSVFERSMPSDLIRGWVPVRVKKTRRNKNSNADKEQGRDG